MHLKMLKDFKIACCLRNGIFTSGVYIRMTDEKGNPYDASRIKTTVAPIKQLSIPRLELCGTVILAKLLKHVAKILNVPSSNVFARTDSRVTLGWLQGNPRRFLAFIGKRVAEISKAIPVAFWRHVKGSENSADCASRGIFPAELAEHDIWWNLVERAPVAENRWNVKRDFEEHPVPSEERDIQRVLLPITTSDPPMLERISSYSHLACVTAWMLRFVKNCKERGKRITSLVFSLEEITRVERLWWQVSQKSAFREEIMDLRNGKGVCHKNKILTYYPLVVQNLD